MTITEAERRALAELVAEQAKAQQDALHRPPSPGHHHVGPPPPPPGNPYGMQELHILPPPDPRCATPDGQVVLVSTPDQKARYDRAWREQRLAQTAALVEDLRRMLAEEGERLCGLRAQAEGAWAEVQALGKPRFGDDIEPAWREAELARRFLVRLAWAQGCKAVETAEEGERNLRQEISDAQRRLKAI